MRGRTPSEGRFVGTGSAHVALTIGSRALGASEPRQVRKEAALRTPSQVPRLRPIRAGDAGTSGDADLEGGARDRALEQTGRRSEGEKFGDGAQAVPTLGKHWNDLPYGL